MKKIKKTEKVNEPELEICAYSDTLIMIPFPTAAISQQLFNHLESEYSSNYKIWNLSEYSYDCELFSGKCLEFLYIGYPNPHLSIFFSIFESIYRWLSKTPQNKALLHCQKTRTRSCMVLAGYLLWSSEEKIIMNAFRKVTKACGHTVELLPSQLRYLKYLQELIDRPVPNSRRLKIKKIIVDGIPRIEKDGSVRPYLQIYQNSDMIYCSHDLERLPQVYSESDMSFVFDLDLEVEEDVLIRCRHLGKNKTFTIFRVMFHTAFVEGEVFRFSRQDIDGAFVDSRFPELFTLDFFLEKNEEIMESSFAKSIFMKEEGKTGSYEDVKIDKDSDDDIEEYFRQLDSK